MKFLRGSKLTLANGVVVVIEKNTEISFPNSNIVSSQIGFLQVTNNFEQTDVQASNNLPANKVQFRWGYDPNGNLLGIEDQLEDGQTLDAFIAKLNPEDADLFGVMDRRNELLAEAKRLADEAKAAKKAAGEKV